ncbi:RNA polymerase sigma factor [compost metagenome]
MLAGINERRAQTLVLAYFGGLERSEIAQTLEVSVRTVDRELRLGEAWLAQALA